MAKAFNTGHKCLVPVGAGAPPNHHAGETESFYVIEGQLGFFIDGEDFVAGPGACIFETANSNHTLKVLDDSPEDMILLSVMDGNLLTYDDEGNIWAIDDAQTQLTRYLALAAEQGLEVDESLIHRT